MISEFRLDQPVVSAGHQIDAMLMTDTPTLLERSRRAIMRSEIRLANPWTAGPVPGWLLVPVGS